MACNICWCGSVETPIWNVMREMPPRLQSTPKDLLRDRFSITDQQCASGSALGVELSARGGWPATFLSNFGKGVRIARIEYFRGFFRGVREKANGVKTYSKLLGGMTSPAPRRRCWGSNKTEENRPRANRSGIISKSSPQDVRLRAQRVASIA